MKPKKDEGKPQKVAADANATAASNDMIMAAINAQATELTKVSKLLDDMKKSMEGRFDAIESRLTTLQKEHREAEHRMDTLDETVTAVDARITALEATCMDLQVANKSLKTKLNDLEGRSRRLNIRIVGVREGEEGGHPTEYVSRLIPELLGEDNFDKPVKVDRAHRSLRPKPAAGERPRIIIAKLHNDRDLATILRLSRQKAPLQHQGSRVSIFPDYTAEVTAQRQAFNKVRKMLTETGAKCTLRFPAKLHVEHNSEVKIFESPEDAERFAKSLAN